MNPFAVKHARALSTLIRPAGDILPGETGSTTALGGTIGGAEGGAVQTGTCNVTVSEGMYLRPVPRFDHVASDPYFPSGTAVSMLALTPYTQSGSTLWRVSIGGQEGYVLLKSDGSTVHQAGDPCDYSSIGDDATPLSAAPQPIRPRTSTTPRTGQPGGTTNAGMLSGTKVLAGLAIVAAGAAAWQNRAAIRRWARRLGR